MGRRALGVRRSASVMETALPLGLRRQRTATALRRGALPRLPARASRQGSAFMLALGQRPLRLTRSSIQRRDLTHRAG